MRQGLAVALFFGIASSACSAPKAEGSRPAQLQSARIEAATPAMNHIGPRGHRGVLAALGESVTLGISNTSPSMAFPAQVGRLVGMGVANLAARNLRTVDVTRQEVPRISRDAAVVLIDVGTIDATAAATKADPPSAVRNVKRLEPDFDALLSAVRLRVPQASIVIVTVRDLGRAGIDTPIYRAASLTAAIHEWNAHERLLGARQGCFIVDTEVDAEWYVAADYDRGRIHPNDAGAARLARAIAEVLQRADSLRSHLREAPVPPSGGNTLPAS